MVHKISRVPFLRCSLSIMFRCQRKKNENIKSIERQCTYTPWSYIRGYDKVLIRTGFYCSFLLYCFYLSTASSYIASTTIQWKEFLFGVIFKISSCINFSQHEDVDNKNYVSDRDCVIEVN